MYVFEIYIVGHMDTLLSEEGIKQVQLAGIKLQDEDFTYVFSSDLTRAREVSNLYCTLLHYISAVTGEKVA